MNEIMLTLNESLSGMVSDITMFLVWAVGLIVVVMVVRKLAETFNVLTGKNEDDNGSSNKGVFK